MRANTRTQQHTGQRLTALPYFGSHCRFHVPRTNAKSSLTIGPVRRFQIVDPSWATTTQLIVQRPTNNNTPIFSVRHTRMREKKFHRDRPFRSSHGISTVPYPWSAWPMVLRLEHRYEPRNVNGTLLPSHHHQKIVVLVTGNQVQVPRTIFALFFLSFARRNARCARLKSRSAHSLALCGHSNLPCPSHRGGLAWLSTCGSSGGWLALMVRV